ncbi:hypothetical protein [Rheinheimera fenheensis]|uniref:hypothetical protein n=1 Tax=Rheinheimera fenheensis TaxID=3152295 RepID=UPI0032607F2C
MSVSNISGNSATQVQLYAQEKANTVSARQEQPRAEVPQAQAAGDSVQISERARALLQRDSTVSTRGNGEGIEPPKTSGNGEGIEPPKTLGNGEGIEPPKV